MSNSISLPVRVRTLGWVLAEEEGVGLEVGSGQWGGGRGVDGLDVHGGITCLDGGGVEWSGDVGWGGGMLCGVRSQDKELVYLRSRIVG